MSEWGTQRYGAWLSPTSTAVRHSIPLFLPGSQQDPSIPFMTLSHIPESIRGDPWFEDGNIILIAVPEDTQTDDSAVAFKVHRGVLARQSEVFQSMFDVAQPPLDAENVEACPVLRMYDVPLELSNLIKAVYDGAHGLYVSRASVSCRMMHRR